MTMIRPFLMFQGAVAAKAIDLYVTTFDGAVLSSVPHADPKHGIQLAELVIKGQSVLISDSSVDHAFDFFDHLIGHAEDMRVVLGEAAHAQHAVQGA